MLAAGHKATPPAVMYIHRFGEHEKVKQGIRDVRLWQLVLAQGDTAVPGERTRKVEGGALAAAGLDAALVLDVDHALGLVLRAEDAALLAGEVEVGHAGAAWALALAVLRSSSSTSP